MKNILYLLNHKTLSDFEIPILINKGFPCYVPKINKSLGIENSINRKTNWFYDNFLNMDSDVIKYLNSIDWYKNTILDEKTIDIINNNFSIIFLTLLCNGDRASQLMAKFKGKIYFRFFGFEGKKSYIKSCNARNTFLYDKVNYIFSYKEIYDFETSIGEKFNKTNSYIIPLGISNMLINKISKTYNPKFNKIAFVCSRIRITQYYRNIYENFIKHFSNFNYSIYGKNNENINNPNINNNLCDDDYYKEIAKCKCMYYHSEEERHLHYHPLEAIIIGIPVIFLEKSLLSSYLTDSPGKCKNIDEAKIKIQRIMENDDKIINSIISVQDKSRKNLMSFYNKNIFDELLSTV